MNLAKKRKQVDRGDIVAIPIEVGQEVFAQVCWASSRYKDLIQIVFLASRTEEELHGTLVFLEPTLFTGAQAVRKGRWRKLFIHQQLYTPCPPIFYSAGAIHDGDDYLREATEEERKNLLNLSALGAALVEQKASKIMASQPPSACDSKPSGF